MPYEQIPKDNIKRVNKLALAQKMVGNTLSDKFNNYQIAAVPIKEDMISAVGGEENLYGLQYMTKGIDSFTRKVISDQKNYYKDKAVEQVATGVIDAIRFTQIVPEKIFSEEVKKTLKNLEALNYKCIRVYNTWLNPQVPYKGINILFSSPYGYICELQFHTTESMKVKDELHEYYEERRLDSTTPERKHELDEIMSGLSSKLVEEHTPYGVEDIYDNGVKSKEGVKQYTANGFSFPHTKEIANLWDID